MWAWSTHNGLPCLALSKVLLPCLLNFRERKKGAARVMENCVASGARISSWPRILPHRLCAPTGAGKPRNSLAEQLLSHAPSLATRLWIAFPFYIICSPWQFLALLSACVLSSSSCNLWQLCICGRASSRGPAAAQTLDGFRKFAWTDVRRHWADAQTEEKEDEAILRDY